CPKFPTRSPCVADTASSFSCAGRVLCAEGSTTTTTPLLYVTFASGPSTAAGSSTSRWYGPGFHSSTSTSLSSFSAPRRSPCNTTLRSFTSIPMFCGSSPGIGAAIVTRLSLRYTLTGISWVFVCCIVWPPSRTPIESAISSAVPLQARRGLLTRSLQASRDHVSVDWRRLNFGAPGVRVSAVSATKLQWRRSTGGTADNKKAAPEGRLPFVSPVASLPLDSGARHLAQPRDPLLDR